MDKKEKEHPDMGNVVESFYAAVESDNQQPPKKLRKQKIIKSVDDVPFKKTRKKT